MLNSPSTETSTLNNGIRVATESSHGETATVGVWIDAGSRYESKETSGTAHFLEHMNFKGTTNRTQQQLEVEIENMGGHLNAYTSREQTVYYAKVFKQDVPKAMEMLSDILQNATLDNHAIEIERDVILREMEEVYKQEEEYIFDKLHETAFQDNPLGRTILGPKENILSITRDNLKDYVDTHYTADRFVIAGAGGVEHDQLKELTEKYFGNLPTKSKNPENAIIKPAIFTGSGINVRDDSVPLAHILVAFEAAYWTSPDVFPLMLMQIMLGCWDRTSGSGANMSSKLCQTVAEREAAHSVMSFNTCYKDTGLFGIYGVCEPTEAQELTWIMMEAMVSLCHEVTNDQVEKAKLQLKSMMLSQLDDYGNIAEDIGRQMLTYNRRLSTPEIFARIDAVDANDIKAAANLYINDQDVAVSSFGNIYEVPDYSFIRRRTYWLRA